MGEHILREVFNSLSSELSLESRVGESPTGKFDFLQGGVYLVELCNPDGWDMLMYRDSLVSITFNNKYSDDSKVINVSYCVPVPCIDVVKCALSKIDNPIARAISGQVRDIDPEMRGTYFFDKTDNVDAVRELITSHILGLF